MTNSTELENELRMHAEDIHSRIGYTDISCVMSKAADMIVSLTAERDGWKSEALEESRLNGMGAEREAKLRQELLTAHCQYEDWTKERTALKAKLEVAQRLLFAIGEDTHYGCLDSDVRVSVYDFIVTLQGE